MQQWRAVRFADYVVRTWSYPLGLWQICMETDSIIPCHDTANDLQIAPLLKMTLKCPMS